MISISLLRGFLIKELKQSLRNPKMKIILFVMPMIQLIIFGVAISTNVKNIRLWAQPDANDTVLQHIYERSIESTWFLPAASEKNRNEDPFNLLKSTQIDAALIPPPGGLTKSIGRGEGQLQLLVDAMNVIQGQSVAGYLQAIGEQVLDDDFNRPIKESPVDFTVRVLYNPSLETTYFMIPGMLSILLCTLTTSLSSTAIAREKEMGTLERLISAPVSPAEIILGKTVPYVVIGLCDMPLILSVAIVGFGVPMRGSFLVMALASFVYVCATVSIGTLISLFARNQQQSILGGFLFLFPAIMLSGMMFPLENMPVVLQWVAYLNPIAHFMTLVRDITLKGGELLFLLEHIGVLILISLGLVFICFKRFHTTLT